MLHKGGGILECLKALISRTRTQCRTKHLQSCKLLSKTGPFTKNPYGCATNQEAFAGGPVVSVAVFVAVALPPLLLLWLILLSRRSLTLFFPALFVAYSTRTTRRHSSLASFFFTAMHLLFDSAIGTRHEAAVWACERKGCLVVIISRVGLVEKR